MVTAASGAPACHVAAEIQLRLLSLWEKKKRNKETKLIHTKIKTLRIWRVLESLFLVNSSFDTAGWREIMTSCSKAGGSFVRLTRPETGFPESA